MVFKGGLCIENMKLHILFGGNMFLLSFPFFFFFLDYGKMMDDF